MNSIKLILVGEAQVGKTAIINQYIQNTFEEEYIATIGQEKQTKEIILKNGTKFKLEIWDTIGQDTYSAANKIFMRNAKIALLVYDITNKESFNNLNKFYKQVCDINGKDIIIGVVGNKNDLYEERTVEEEEGQKYAKDIKASFFETSAKDHETIESLFEGICEQLNNKDKKNNNNGKENSNNNNDGNNVISQSNEGFKISSSPNQPKTSEKKGWC